MNNARLLLFAVLVFLFFCLLVFKLVDIQLFNSDELSYFAKRQQTNTEIIKAERGYVFDRNNVLLVYNRNDISFYVDLRMLSSAAKKELARRFSQAFGKSKNHYLNLLKQSGKTICLEKKADYESAAELMNYKLAGLFYKEEPTRIYHYGSLASHILGYVNNEYEGVNGIAKRFEDELNGEDGAILVERNAIGEIISVLENQKKKPQAGCDIYLTIDKNYQTILEEELKKAVRSYSAETAVGIIMNPNTGEILAMSNINDYNPNHYWKYSDFERKNRAITDVYEPGSTFKVVTLSALLDEKICNESEVIDVENGKYKFRNVYIKDTHKNNRLTVKGIIEESSNIGISKLIQRMKDEEYYNYVRAFGFGTYTSVTLPGEVTGRLHKPADWSKVTKTFMSFGYNISVTPLQLTTAFCAVINGGTLYQPLIVKKLLDKNENDVMEFLPIKVREVISEKTSQRMRKLLVSAVENGTGNQALIDNISVGGKTGTSKVIVNGNYSDNQYHSTFIGFFPAENPQIVCFVLVNKPRGEYYGGKVSAPVFKNIAERIIKSEPEKFYGNGKTYDEEITTPDEEVMINQWFVNNEDLEETKIKNVIQQNNLIVNNNVMPDLRGRTVKEALAIVNELSIKYNVIGSGIVIKQSIKPGSSLSKNLICNIHCSDKMINGTRIY